ncbi:FHA domain-containing protein [Sphingomonas paeninsulae]|jgi:predicted component of type VI protein secretion system|uniref:FHA domain-containing protein n=1 Tax=Sphingomonas paeninsulae TaxID=2319844 RepID=A0A494TJK4_SPHPE|nr:type VI secretion system-associated FHA domain protein [Sphingomonas paeninsulae]AYJ85941.1 FHA domain-containing protein [Sphingomonas paeninsulae]
MSALYILKMFENADLAQPVDARLLRAGTITIGRDPANDWAIADPKCEISRRHCQFDATDEGLTLTVQGANGVYDADTQVRLPDNVAAPVSVPSSFLIGDYRIVVAPAPQTNDGDQREGQTLILSPPLGTSIDIPADYNDSEYKSGQPGDGSLLGAFCEGAGLDVSAFALEDPDVIMRRAGAVYRQMVLGLGDLMVERERVRQQFRIARTTIGSANNNPFKWAPTQRLALDLLLAEEHGFLSGPAALKASFKDIKKHLIATFAGLHKSLIAAVKMFDPEVIDAATASQGSLLKPRSTIHVEEHGRRHRDLMRQIEGGEDGTLNHVFVAEYDAISADLESRLA